MRAILTKSLQNLKLLFKISIIRMFFVYVGVGTLFLPGGGTFSRWLFGPFQKQDMCILLVVIQVLLHKLYKIYKIHNLKIKYLFINCTKFII